MFPLASVATLAAGMAAAGAAVAAGAGAGLSCAIGWGSVDFRNAAMLLAMVSCCSVSGVGEGSGAAGTATGAGAGSACGCGLGCGVAAGSLALLRAFCTAFFVNSCTEGALVDGALGEVCAACCGLATGAGDAFGCSLRVGLADASAFLTGAAVVGFARAFETGLAASFGFGSSLVSCAVSFSN